MLNGALPPFALEGGPGLALVRAVWLAALLGAFGGLLFRETAAARALSPMPAAAAEATARSLTRLTTGMLLVALAAGVGWLLLQAGVLAERTDPAGIIASCPTVLARTRFGHLLGTQELALAAALLCLDRGAVRRRRVAAVALASLALLLEAGHGHGAAAPSLAGIVLLLANLAHLFAAAAWLGGLPPLLLLVRGAPVVAAAAAARAFSPLGRACVLAVLGSAIVQGLLLIGGLPALLGSAYGWVALVKLGLFAALTGFALLNRYRLAPALRHGDAAVARRRLARSIALQTATGTLTLLAAALLASLPPGAHVQPVWPFAVQFSLTTLREAPELRPEVLRGAAELAGAGLLLTLAVWRARRGLRKALPMLAAAVAVAWVALPHLDLLLVPATPTSFQLSPTGFAADAMMQGAALYPAACAGCHGAQGHGDGPLAKSLPVPPADLTAPHLWAHPDGELFWWLSHGIEAPLGGMAMPGFAASLSDEQIWDLIDFIRARNAGLVWRETRHWSLPIPTPALEAECPHGSTLAPGTARGQILRLAFTATGTSVTIPERPADPPCVADDPAVRAAYGLVTGQAPEAMLGAEALVDADGWLRAVQLAGQAGGGWEDPRQLAAALDFIRTHPLRASTPAHHHHG